MDFFPPFFTSFVFMAEGERELRSFAKSRSPRQQQNLLLSPYPCYQQILTLTLWGEKQKASCSVHQKMKNFC